MSGDVIWGYLAIASAAVAVAAILGAVGLIFRDLLDTVRGNGF